MRYFLREIFEDTYVGLVHSGFVALRKHYSHLILEHVSSRRSKVLVRFNIADLFIIHNWLALASHAPRESDFDQGLSVFTNVQCSAFMLFLRVHELKVDCISATTLKVNLPFEKVHCKVLVM